MSSVALQQPYAALPQDAQLSIAYAVGSIPMSATPVSIFEAGKSWGIIVQSGPDRISLTPYGEKVMNEEIARKDAIVREQEGRARARAGDAAGRYLDDLGKTDLATLKPEEWAKFCMTMCDTYMYWRLSSK